MANTKEMKLKAVITATDKLSPKLKGIQGKVASFRKSLSKSGLTDMGWGDLMTGGAFAAPFVQATRQAIDFESQMADVRKVVDFPTPEAFKEMSNDILNMSRRLPMAANGIAAIIASGGQSGIARAELAGFAEDAVKMGIAFDQTAEEAGDQMAKWRTAFKLTQPEVVALADKINYLSNNGAATAKQISGIVTKIGPLGEVAGLASGEIAAMGATLAGMGVAEDVAATGMKNFMLTMTSGKAATATQAKVFRALRMNAEDIASGMQKDAKGTMLRVLKAISQVDPTEQAAVLAQLFGKESIGAIAPMLTNLDLLKKNFEHVGDASKYTGSMLGEYEARSKTTANSLQLLKNQASALAITVGSVLLPPIVSITAQIAPLIESFSSLIEQNPWIVKGLVGAAAGFVALKGTAMAAATAARVFNAVLSASPWVRALKIGVALVGMLVANWDEACVLVKRFRDWWLEIMNTDGVQFLKNLWKGTKSLFKSEELTKSPLKGGVQQMSGAVTVSFANAQPGTRVSKPETRGGLAMSTNVGYASNFDNMATGD